MHPHARESWKLMCELIAISLKKTYIVQVYELKLHNLNNISINFTF